MSPDETTGSDFPTSRCADATSRARASDPGSTSPAPRVTLIGRPGCHLCDDARVVVAGVAGELGVGWREVSIDDDAELRARYADEIPVVLVDGVQHTYWHVDEQRLRDALAESAASGARHWLRRRRRR
ncbi:MAG: glutaredoxin family protein [Actinomycetes bacterium]